MEPTVLQAGPESAGVRLDSFLAAQLEDLTRSAAQRLIETGQVTVDGRTVPKSCKLTGTELVTAAIPEPEPVNAVPQDIPLDVVYEDGDVTVSYTHLTLPTICSV